ncbi:MAG: CbiX/SirB N-terminal domain-containing protein [Eubacteriaceae bacterium]|nr:CbiX/SirB N-terminal domain-containing protein [Eubacteriaceae bacterium]
MKGVLVLAHGSRATETEDTLDQVLTIVKEKTPDTIIECAFMEFSDRTVAKGFETMDAHGVTQLKVVPYFLFMGIHLQQDIPKILAECSVGHPNIKYELTGTLGIDERIADIIVERIKD